MLHRSSPPVLPQQGAAPLELQLVRQERDALQRERDLLMQQVEMLRSMQQTTQQQLTGKLNKSKSTISQLANDGRLPEIERVLEHYERMIKQLS